MSPPVVVASHVCISAYIVLAWSLLVSKVLAWSSGFDESSSTSIASTEPITLVRRYLYGSEALFGKLMLKLGSALEIYFAKYCSYPCMATRCTLCAAPPQDAQLRAGVEESLTTGLPWVQIIGHLWLWLGFIWRVAPPPEIDVPSFEFSLSII